MKNKLGTREFPCSSVGATPYWGKGQQVEKEKKRKRAMSWVIYKFFIPLLRSVAP